MAKPKLLNVRKHLEYEIWAIDRILERSKKHEITLAPFDEGMLNELRFFAKAILRKHASKKTRKDVYVGVTGGLPDRTGGIGT